MDNNQNKNQLEIRLEQWLSKLTKLLQDDDYDYDMALDDGVIITQDEMCNNASEVLDRFVSKANSYDITIDIYYNKETKSTTLKGYFYNNNEIEFF